MTRKREASAIARRGGVFGDDLNLCTVMARSCKAVKKFSVRSSRIIRNHKRSFARKFVAPLAAAFVASFSISGLAVEIDGRYSNLFVLNNDLAKDGFKFGFGWDPAKVGAGITQTGTSLTLKPETITRDGGAADKNT